MYCDMSRRNGVRRGAVGVRDGCGLCGELDVMRWRKPPSCHAGVIGVYGFRFRPSRPQQLLVLPSPVVRVAISVNGRRLRVADATTTCPDWLECAAVRARVDTRAVVLALDRDLACVEVVLAPWAAFRALGVVPGGWAAPAVDVSCSDTDGVRDLAGRLAEARSWEQRLLIAGLGLSRRYAAGPPPAPVVVDAFDTLRRVGGRISIRSLARSCGCSERLLEKRFCEQIGVSPKAVARVLRLRRAAALLSHGRPVGAVAVACGYSDQAHLTREFTAMAGISPARYLRGYCQPAAGSTAEQPGSDSFNTAAAGCRRLGLAMVVHPRTATSGTSRGTRGTTQ